MSGDKQTAAGAGGSAVSQRDKGIWRAALTLAHNMCTQDLDRVNDNDGPLEAVHALSDEAKRIRGWLEPSDEQLSEMLLEAGVPDDGLAGALGSDGGEWLRGYYCAVAAYLRENCAPGVCDTEGSSLFGAGGDWRRADPEDIATFQAHGLVPPNASAQPSRIGKEL